MSHEQLLIAARLAVALGRPRPAEWVTEWPRIGEVLLGINDLIGDARGDVEVPQGDDLLGMIVRGYVLRPEEPPVNRLAGYRWLLSRDPDQVRDSPQLIRENPPPAVFHQMYGLSVGVRDLPPHLSPRLRRGEQGSLAGRRALRVRPEGRFRVNIAEGRIGVIECWSAPLSPAALIGSGTAFRQEIQVDLMDKLEQLDGVINDLESGALALSGGKPDGVPRLRAHPGHAAPVPSTSGDSDGAAQ